MQKDIKKIIRKNNNNSNHNLPKNHRNKFENLLQKELHSKNKNYAFLEVAVSLLLLFSLSYVGFKSIDNKPNIKQNYSLSSLSPELEKIENYYTNAISYELAKIEINEENQLILNKYFNKIDQLTNQYQNQSASLNIDKINKKTINALIDNLQMRLQLLLQLKQQLKTIKNKNNEKHKI